MADAWNKDDFTIPGAICALSIVDYTDGTVTELDRIALA